MNRITIKDRLTERLKQEEGIVVAYIFGSFLKKTFAAESDLDVGILFKENAVPDAAGLFEMQSRLSSAAGISVDLACLNEATPILAAQVLRNGEKIIEPFPHESAEFWIRVASDYADLKRIRKPIEARILKGRVYG